MAPAAHSRPVMLRIRIQALFKHNSTNSTMTAFAHAAHLAQRSGISQQGQNQTSERTRSGHISRSNQRVRSGAKTVDDFRTSDLPAHALPSAVPPKGDGPSAQQPHVQNCGTEKLRYEQLGLRFERRQYYWVMNQTPIIETLCIGYRLQAFRSTYHLNASTP